MQKIIGLFCTLIFLAPAAAAGEKTHTFTATCDQVWMAEKAVVTANYELSKFDDATQTAKFEKPKTGSHIAFDISTRLSPDGAACTMRLSGLPKVSIGGFLGQFFGQLEDQLKRGN